MGLTIVWAMLTGGAMLTMALLGIANGLRGALARGRRSAFGKLHYLEPRAHSPEP